MITVVHQGLGQIQECFTGGVDVQSAVNNPAGGGGVFNSVPDVTVAGNNGVTLGLQFLSSLKELVPVAGAGADLLSDDSGIIGTPNVLGDGAAVDEGAAGCLVAQTHQLAVGGTGADVDGVLSNVSSLGSGSDVDAQIFVSSSELSGIALAVLQNESGLSAVDVGSVSAAGLQSLVQSGLVQTVSGSDDGGVHIVLGSHIGMGFHVLGDHAGNLIGKGHDVDGDLGAVGSGSLSSGSLGSGSLGSGGLGGSRSAIAGASAQTENHHTSQEHCEQFLHFVHPPFLIIPNA